MSFLFPSNEGGRKKKGHSRQYGPRARRRHKMKGRFHGKPDNNQHKVPGFGPSSRSEFDKYSG